MAIQAIIRRTSDGVERRRNFDTFGEAFRTVYPAMRDGGFEQGSHVEGIGGPAANDENWASSALAAGESIDVAGHVYSIVDEYSNAFRMEA